MLSTFFFSFNHHSLRFQDEEIHYFHSLNAIFFFLVQQTYLRYCNFIVFHKDAIKCKIIKICLGEPPKGRGGFKQLNVLERRSNEQQGFKK